VVGLTRKPERETAKRSLKEVLESEAELQERVQQLELRVTKAEERRRALIHIMSDLNQLNRRLGNQRKAMIHILVDYEGDRSRLARQTDRLDGSRRALLHILKDSHQSNLRLENSRKAMIHIMDDLRQTTEQIQRRERELREKQEQLVQAGKMATLGELTTGVAHELNNPLNNIGLFVGNAIDMIELGIPERERVLGELTNAMGQVRKASEIISHLRKFGRAAPVSREPFALNEVIKRALDLMRQQLRMRQIEVTLDLCGPDLTVLGNAIQIEQVFINLLNNSRDAVANAAERRIHISCSSDDNFAEIRFRDTGPGIPEGLEQRIFDPFFTTKEVGEGTGLGLSITYSIIKDHDGAINVEKTAAGDGAVFLIRLPLGAADSQPEVLL